MYLEVYSDGSNLIPYVKFSDLPNPQNIQLQPLKNSQTPLPLNENHILFL